MLKDTVCEQKAVIPSLVEDAVMRLFDEAGKATVSSLEDNVLSVIQTMVNQPVTYAFQSFAFHTAVGRVVQKCLAASHVVNDVVIRTIDVPAFTVPLAKFLKKTKARNAPSKKLKWN